MCDVIELPDGTTLRTVRDLYRRGWVHRSDVDEDVWEEMHYDEACLCCVDTDRILKREVTRFTYDPCGVYDVEEL